MTRPAVLISRLTLFAAAMAIAACERKPANTDTTTTTMAPAAAPESTTAAPPIAVTIVSPKDGDTTGANVTVVMSKSGPVSIEKASSSKVEGVGHYHLFVDTSAVADGELIPPATKQIIHIGTGDSTYTLKGLSKGPHQIIAVIGYGDHTMMAARRDTVNIVVK